MGLNRKIYIEPGLLEWFGWFKTGFPSFFTNEEFVDFGYNVAYWEPVLWPRSKFNSSETAPQHYYRSHWVVKNLLDRHKNDGEYRETDRERERVRERERERERGGGCIVPRN